VAKKCPDAGGNQHRGGFGHFTTEEPVAL